MDEVVDAERFLKLWNEADQKDHTLIFFSERNHASMSFLYSAGKYIVRHTACIDIRKKKPKFIEGIIVLLAKPVHVLVDKIVAYHPFDEQDIDFCIDTEKMVGYVEKQQLSIGDALNKCLWDYMTKFKKEPDRVANRLKSAHSGKVRQLPRGTVVSGGLPTLGKRR